MPASRETGHPRISYVINVFMSEVTRVLSQIDSGDPHAAEQLLPLVYSELRKLAAIRLAQEKPGQTLQATALVHEAYLRLVGANEAPHWNNRGHFFAAAAEAMRRILVEQARRRHAHKRGGQRDRQELLESGIVASGDIEETLAIDEILDRLATIDPLAANLVKLRFFVGLTMIEHRKNNLVTSELTAFNTLMNQLLTRLVPA